MNKSSRPSRLDASHQLVSRRLFALLTVIVMLASFSVTGPASAAVCGPTDLVPQVRGYSINQGLSSYASLVRGKDIVFRLFLSRPQCADGTTASVALTGATLNVKAGAVTLLSVSRPTNTLNPAPLLPYWKDAPAVLDSTGDPKWVIDGAALRAKAPSTNVPLTFESTLSYTNSAGGSGTTLPIATHNGRPITKTLLADTTPLRVLAIPMGDPTKAYSTQFGPNAHMSTLDGFAVLGRTFPLADGTADLTQVTAGTTAGMRYHLNTNALLDVKSYMTSGLFCDSGLGLERKIAPQMETHLKQYNTANPLAKSADRVLGVIDQAISSSCAEGMALVDGKFSYVRARYKTDPATNKVVPTMTGALMGMEQGHNFGAVPCGSEPASQSECPVDRDNVGDAHHSQNTFAHSTETSEYPDVAYNLLSEQAVANDLNVMNYASQGPGTWLNSNTFLQKEDWALLICKLGGPTSPDCVLPVDGSAAAVGAVSTTTIVGTTDGTKANTEVFDSYADVDGAPDKPRNSFIHLIQKNSAGQVLQDDPVELTGDGDGHHGASGNNTSDVKVFSASYATPDEAVELELVNIRTGEVLYERFKSGGGPRNVSTTVTMTGVTPVGCTSDCPPPAPMTSAAEFGAGVETLDFETDGDGQASTAGTAAGTEYFLSKGVRFEDDARTTPKIIGDCTAGHNPCRFPVGTGTRSGRFGLWNSPDTLPVGPLDPVPDSRGVPLTIDFTRPVQKVGMYIGNDDLNNTTATLTAFDALNQPIDGAQVSKSSFGSASSTFIGLDAGTTNVARVQLDYGNSPLGEEIDDLMFERPAGSGPTTTWRVTTTAEDDPAGEMRAAFFAKCSASNEVLASGEKPVLVNEQKATFTYDFDAKNLCRDPDDGDLTTILVRLNDGFTQTGFDAVSVEGVSESRLTAVIDSPDAEARAHSVLQHEPITLSGQGWDANEGVLPGSNLTWLVKDQQGGIVSSGQTGNDLTLVPPSGTRWVPGTYSAKLTVRNSAGMENSTETTFQVLEDKDNDGIPVNVEGCYEGNDSDPNDAFGDYDKDGVVNQQDEEPCTARVVYEGQADFDPNTLNYPSQGGGTSVTMKIRFRYRDVAQVNGKSIRITRLGGKAVPATKVFETTGWTLGTERGVAFGVAKFDRQAIIDFLCPTPDNCQTNQTVWITIAGDAPAASGKPAFSFNASDSFQVQKG